jgi:quercetin dioxygenase-like cupin family protein
MTDPTDVQFFSYDDADALHPVPGIEMRAVFGAGASVNLVHLAGGAELPLHSHPHEQIGVVLEGVLVLIVGGREHHLGVNEACVVPGGVEHGGRGGPEGGRVLDVFIPGRDDYRSAAAPPRV